MGFSLFVFVESVWGLAMASSTCARRCASAGLKLARAASAAPATAGRTAGGEGFGFVVNRPQAVVGGGGGGGRIGGMVMAMECWRSPMMVQAQLMSCCAKVDNPPPREVSFLFFWWFYVFFGNVLKFYFFFPRFFACEVMGNVCKSYTSQAFVKLSVRYYMRTGSPLLKHQNSRI